MKIRCLTAVLLIAAVSLVSACGGDSDDSSSSPTAVATSTEGDSDGDGGSSDGDSSSGGSGGGATVDLGDFPVPLPDWADAVTPNLSNELDVILFTVPLDQQEATVAFYADWTDSQPENYIRSDSASGGVSFQGEVEAGEEKTIISILAPLEGDDFVSVSLSRGAFE
jgi:hypothetical protein